MGGNFTYAGDEAANHIAKWDGAQWSWLGSGIIDDVIALPVFDDGTGEALYAGGRFIYPVDGPLGIAAWRCIIQRRIRQLAIRSIKLI